MAAEKAAEKASKKRNLDKTTTPEPSKEVFINYASA